MTDKKIYLGLAILFTGMPMFFGKGWPVAIAGLIFFMYILLTMKESAIKNLLEEII
jgi:protein-S-isoprenylcysteine O-methyltransferase Ste14